MLGDRGSTRLGEAWLRTTEFGIVERGRAAPGGGRSQGIKRKPRVLGGFIERDGHDEEMRAGPSGIIIDKKRLVFVP